MADHLVETVAVMTAWIDSDVPTTAALVEEMGLTAALGGLLSLGHGLLRLVAEHEGVEPLVLLQNYALEVERRRGR